MVALSSFNFIKQLLAIKMTKSGNNSTKIGVLNNKTSGVLKAGKVAFKMPKMAS